jgi:8-oxo-dGTP pyrophosphatase MutT (NUDIX family)
MDCVIRETFEETGITIRNPKEVGYIEFPTKNFYVHVFKSTEFSGQLKVNEAEVEASWVDKDKVPYDDMREADRDFLPEILSGKYGAGDVIKVTLEEGKMTFDKASKRRSKKEKEVEEAPAS